MQMAQRRAQRSYRLKVEFLNAWPMCRGLRGSDCFTGGNEGNEDGGLARTSAVDEQGAAMVGTVCL